MSKYRLELRATFSKHTDVPYAPEEGVFSDAFAREVQKAMRDFTPAPIVATLIEFDENENILSTRLLETCY